MSDPLEDLETRLARHAATWQAALPTPPRLPEERFTAASSRRTRRLLLTLASAAAVLIAIAVPVAVLQPGSEDQELPLNRPEPPAPPVPTQSTCRTGTPAPPGSTFTFHPDIPMMSSIPPSWTLTLEETAEFRALLRRSRDGIDEVETVPDDVGFAGYLVQGGTKQQDFLQGLGIRSDFRVFDAPGQGTRASAAANFLDQVSRCRDEAERLSASSDEPAAPDAHLKTFCAHVLFEGRTYEVSEQQEQPPTNFPLAPAEGISCGSEGNRTVEASRLQGRSRRDAIMVHYAGYEVIYVPEFTAGLTPVPYPNDLQQVGDVRGSDLALARAFAAFAVRTEADTLSALPLAPDGVQVGLGLTLRRTPVADLAQAATWSSTANGFAGRTGRINTLNVLRDHLLRDLIDSGPNAGKLQVVEGETQRCAGPPLAAPAGLVGLRHLSLQPAAGSIEACLDWFSVDLYLDESGRVTAVRLDLVEP